MPRSDAAGLRSSTIQCMQEALMAADLRPQKSPHVVTLGVRR